jgi:hypothetical protein
MNQTTLEIVESSDSPKGRRHVSTGKKVFLTMVQDHTLINLLLTEYAASGMTDADFADYAAGKIGLPLGVIKDHTIKMRRDQFKIVNNKSKPTGPADIASLAATVLAQDMRISQLTERIDMLEGWINATFPLRSGKKAI